VSGATLLAAWLLAQAPPEQKVVLEGKARLSKLAQDLQRLTGDEIRLEPKLEDPEIDIAARGANFFEVLDALCRAHGNAGYFELRSGRELPPDSAVPLFRTTPRVYPSAYFGPFKATVFHFFRERVQSDRGPQARVRVSAGLFFPPHFPQSPRRNVEWKLTEARDADGKDVLLPSSDSPAGPRIELSSSLDPGFPFEETTFTLGDFDLDRGLSLLKGEVSVLGHPGEEVRVPLEAGRRVASPRGPLALQTLEPSGGGWRIVLSLSGTQADPDGFHGRARIDGLEGWCPIRSSAADELEARTGPMAAKPAWITLRAVGNERAAPATFEMRDVRFGKK
jgi:hypothetical protein